MTMTEARVRQQWDHTAELMAMLANCWCRRQGQPAFRSNQFHPLREKKKAEEPDTKKAFAALKEVFAPRSVEKPPSPVVEPQATSEPARTKRGYEFL